MLRLGVTAAIAPISPALYKIPVSCTRLRCCATNPNHKHLVLKNSLQSFGLSSGRLALRELKPLRQQDSNSRVYMMAAGVDAKVTPAKPVALRPLEELDELRAQGLFTKVVHFVRHGEGTHNVEKDYKSPNQLDAFLTPVGKEQCATLAEQTRALKNVELLVSSPLTRCVQTAVLGFSSQVAAGLPFIALESIRETVNFTCDGRRTINEIAPEFPMVDFSQCADDEDPLWGKYAAIYGNQDQFMSHRESDDPLHIAERARIFFRWFKQRPEQEVLVSSHSAFMWHFFNHAHPGYCEEEGFDHGTCEDMVPVVEYDSGDKAFEEFMRSRWANCELRSMVVVYKHNE